MARSRCWTSDWPKPLRTNRRSLICRTHRRCCPRRHPPTILGTTAYMSPEQVKGAVLDRRTDIFAFGAVLYEMLTGQRTFPRETLSEILAAVIHAEPNWSRLPPDIPSGIRRLLSRCLQKDRSRRLRDIADARFQIEEALNDPVRSE